MAVRSRGKFADDLHARLGADRRRRRERHDGGRSDASWNRLRRHRQQRYDLETERARRRHAVPLEPERARTDWTQPLVVSKADPHALYYANQFLFRTTDGGADLDADQSGPDATRSGRSAESRCSVGRSDADRNGKRGVIYAVASVADATRT